MGRGHTVYTRTRRSYAATPVTPGHTRSPRSDPVTRYLVTPTTPGHTGQIGHTDQAGLLQPPVVTLATLVTPGTPTKPATLAPRRPRSHRPRWRMRPNGSHWSHSPLRPSL